MEDMFTHSFITYSLSNMLTSLPCFMSTLLTAQNTLRADVGDQLSYADMPLCNITDGHFTAGNTGRCVDYYVLRSKALNIKLTGWM